MDEDRDTDVEDRDTDAEDDADDGVSAALPSFLDWTAIVEGRAGSSSAEGACR